MEAKRLTQNEWAYKAPQQNRRSLLLLADFDERGLAINWKMAVHRSFQEALDIKLTKIVFGNNSTERWTQGRTFSFRAGDIVWDAPEAYLNYCSKTGRQLKNWGEVLPYITFGVEIISATPAPEGEVTVTLSPDTIENSVDIRQATGNGGSVRFQLLHPDKAKKKVERVLEPYQCTQEAFILLLKTGMFYPHNQIDPLDFFELGTKKANEVT